MAEASRSVAVVLKADVNDYITKMGAASKATKDFASQAGKTAGTAATSTKQLGTAASQSSGQLDKATQSTKAFGDSASKASGGIAKTTKATQDADDKAKSFGQTLADVKTKHSEGFNAVATGMTVAGAAIAAGIGVAVKAFADFDQQMSNVRAVSNATAADMQKLTDAALKAGADTKYSASQAAEAEAELAKAGLSTKDILGGGLNGALSLAAAGNLDLANAATVSANAMNIFSLKGADVGHIADVLASGANKSAADVDQLGQALQQSGLVAAQMGLSLEDTTGILAAFADNGLKGSDAGTSFKTMLQRLVPTSVAAASAMEDIGFSAYDASGNLKSIDVIAGDLQKGLAGLTQKQKDATLATIFGSDAVRGANVLFKLGAAGVRDYTDAVNDQGAAARVAAVQMDNLAGDMENLRGSIETALIKGGSGANDALRGLAQTATEAVNSFSQLPASVQSGVVQMAALASGALLLGGGLITVIPKIVATRAAIDALADSSPRAAAALGTINGKNLALGAVVVGVAAASAEIKNLAVAAQTGDPAVKDLAASLRSLAQNGKNSGAFGELFARGAGPFRQSFEKASDALNDFGANANAATNSRWYETLFGTANEAQTIFGDRVKKIDAALVQLVNSGHGDDAKKIVDQLTGSVTQFGGSADKVREQFTGYNQIVDNAAVANGKYASTAGDMADAADTATGPTKLLGDEIKDQQKAAEDAQKAFDDLTNSVKNYGSEVDDALGATGSYEAALDAGQDRVKKRAEIQAQIAKLTKQDAKGNADEIARLKKELGDYALGLDQSTKAGRANVDVLRDIAKTAKDSAVKNFINGASLPEVEGQIQNAHDAFVKQAQDLGASAGEAENLAKQLGLTKENIDVLAKAPPADVTVNAKTEAANRAINDTAALLDATDGKAANTTVNATTAPAYTAIADTAALLDATDGVTANTTITADAAKALTDANTFDDLMGQLDGKTAKATIQVAYERVGPSLEAITGLADGTLGPKGFAGGGYTGNVPTNEVAGVTHGKEYVFDAPATSRLGVPFLEALRRGAYPGYRDGGYVAPRFADRSMISSAMTTNVNSGGNVTNDRRINIEKVVASDFRSFEREAETRQRLQALGTRRAR